MKPLHADEHCRHYSYRNTGLAGYQRGDPGGPECARGVDLSAPGAGRCCWPEPKAACEKREEYTDDERAAWKAHVASRMVMLAEAIEAIPEPIPTGTSGKTTCPHCAGFLHWTRSRNGHVYLQCTGPDCIGPVHFNVQADRPWPASKVAS